MAIERPIQVEDEYYVFLTVDDGKLFVAHEDLVAFTEMPEGVVFGKPKEEPSPIHKAHLQMPPGALKT